MMRAAGMVVVALASALAVWAGDPKDDPAQIGHRDIARGPNFYSLEKEMALGKQLAEEVERQARLLDDPIVIEYVNRIGQNLARHSDARVPFQFRVVVADAPNAFAFPGGYVFVNSGLIKMADDEAELAAAMAHEVAHVAARHLTRQATRSQLANAASGPLGILLGGWAGVAARHGAKAAIPLTKLHLDRNDEAEADHFGLQYLYAAGYDPGSAVSLFEKLDSLRGRPGTLGKLLAQHPSDADRVAKAQLAIRGFPPVPDGYVVTTSAYSEVRQRLFPREIGSQAGK